MPKRGSGQGLKKMMFMALGVLIVMLIAVLVIIAISDKNTVGDVLPEGVRFVQGVSIAGVDVSGKTLEEAAAMDEIFSKGQEAYSSFSYTIAVAGRQFTYNSQELGLDTSLEGALNEALRWGNTGDGTKRSEQRKQAQESGVDFPAIHADPLKIKDILQSHKKEYDLQPQNATLKVKETFTPGDNADFVPEVKGADVNIAKLTALVCANINKGDLSVVETPMLEIEPKVTLDELKANTGLICSWPSSFKDHAEKDRVTNVNIISRLINGAVIAPMQTWSINETAGDRNAQTAKELGWTEAPGIENGRYSEQYGGGVCQVSSTVYNCAIRSELTIMERFPHSWPSDYIDAGMDATITTGLKDLKILNPFDTPIMLVCHVDETAKTVTVEFYGPPIKNGYTIGFERKLVQTVNPPPTVYHYNVTEQPDGKPIETGKYVEWVRSRKGYTYMVYKFYVDAQGNEVAGSRELLTKTVYRAYQGEYYCNYDDIQNAAPTPDPV